MRILICVAIGLLFMGCSKNKTAAEKDDRLSVQAIALSSEDSALTYKVRVYPNPNWEGNKEELIKKMNYDVDSCFYMLANNKIQYPESILPVANGMATNFEYIISFTNAPKLPLETVLVYHDKYISQKDYKLLMK